MNASIESSRDTTFPFVAHNRSNAIPSACVLGDAPADTKRLVGRVREDARDATHQLPSPVPAAADEAQDEQEHIQQVEID